MPTVNEQPQIGEGKLVKVHAARGSLKFDRNAYQREYMRKKRAKDKAK